MTRRFAVLALGLMAGAAARQAIYESTPQTLTATIESIDKTSRIVTLKTTAGNRLHVNAPDEMEGFASLRIGDVVTATYFEAIAVRLVTPGAPAPSTTPATVVRRKQGRPGSETLREQSVRATVTAVDLAAPSLTVKTTEGTERTMKVTDAAQLKAVKVGDSLDVTFYESRLVSVARPPKKN
jgi:Cu/Ag efflux protein CusF